MKRNIRRLRVAGEIQYTYSAEGWLEAVLYSPYNKNRMVSAVVSGAQISYLYNTNDRRIRRVKNGKAVYYFYNGNKLLYEKYSGNKLSKIYTNDDEGVLGMKRYSYDKDTDEFLNTQKYYYLFDELGSVTALTDESGMPIKYYLYDPYGNVTNTSNDPGNNLTFVGRYGGWKDWDVGFINFWHRWYDSEVGKWTTRDPIGVEGGNNLYQYVQGNPVNGVDWRGLCEEPSTLKVPGGGGGGGGDGSLPGDCTDAEKYQNCIDKCEAIIGVLGLFGGNRLGPELQIIRQIATEVSNPCEKICSDPNLLFYKDHYNCDPGFAGYLDDLLKLKQ